MTPDAPPPRRHHWLGLFWPVALVMLLVGALNGGVLAYLSHSYRQANTQQQVKSIQLVAVAHLNQEVAAIQLLAGQTLVCDVQHGELAVLASVASGLARRASEPHNSGDHNSGFLAGENPSR